MDPQVSNDAAAGSDVSHGALSVQASMMLGQLSPVATLLLEGIYWNYILNGRYFAKFCWMIKARNSLWYS